MGVLHLFCCFNNRISRLAGLDASLTQKSLLRNSLRCQCDPRKTMNKPPTAPPGLVFGARREGLGLRATR